MLGQSAHEGILRSILKRDYDLDVELESELRSFEQHDDHVVVRIAKIGIDSTETMEEAKVSYLVGCDGARSGSCRQSFLFEVFLISSTRCCAQTAGIDLFG